MALVCAMHITAGVWINDDEPGIQADVLEWLDKLAPPSWPPPANEVAEQLLPDPGDYRHHRGGEDNGDAHLKNLLVHHQVIVPVTAGPARPRAVAAGLLLRVRRRPAEAARDQSPRRIDRTGGAGPWAGVRSAVVGREPGIGGIWPQASARIDTLGPTVAYRNAWPLSTVGGRTLGQDAGNSPPNRRGLHQRKRHSALLSTPPRNRTSTGAISAIRSPRRPATPAARLAARSRTRSRVPAMWRCGHPQHSGYHGSPAPAGEVLWLHRSLPSF